MHREHCSRGSMTHRAHGRAVGGSALKQWARRHSKSCTKSNKGIKGVASTLVSYSQQLRPAESPFFLITLYKEPIWHVPIVGALDGWMLQNGHHTGESGPSKSKGPNRREVKRCPPSLSSSPPCLLVSPLFRRTR